MLYLMFNVVLVHSLDNLGYLLKNHLGDFFILWKTDVFHNIKAPNMGATSNRLYRSKSKNTSSTSDFLFNFIKNIFL